MTEMHFDACALGSFEGPQGRRTGRNGRGRVRATHNHRGVEFRGYQRERKREKVSGEKGKGIDNGEPGSPPYYI